MFLLGLMMRKKKKQPEIETDSWNAQMTLWPLEGLVGGGSTPVCGNFFLF